jgi:hypothetical protein
LKNETEKVVQRLCNFARPLNDFFCFLSHVHLRPFSFILNHKAELMDEAAIDDYSSVRICLNSKCKYTYTRLVIGTSRTVGSAKKFVRITSGFGGGEFTKTLRKVCTCQKLKFSFLPLEYCKIREYYAVANAFTIRNMYSLFLYMKCNSRKINRPTKNMTKIVTLVHF